MQRQPVSPFHPKPTLPRTRERLRHNFMNEGRRGEEDQKGIYIFLDPVGRRLGHDGETGCASCTTIITNPIVTSLSPSLPSRPRKPSPDKPVQIPGSRVALVACEVHH